jgi:hypothetical protein
VALSGLKLDVIIYGLEVVLICEFDYRDMAGAKKT